MNIVLAGTEALLVHQMLNNLLNGIHGIHFESQTGMSEVSLREIFEEFSLWVDACDFDGDGVIIIVDSQGQPIGEFERSYTSSEIKALRNMTELVMLELGRDEFFTLTGFSLAEAKQLLDGLNAALLGPLHLDQPAETQAA
jgi:hypothetical protein